MANTATPASPKTFRTQVTAVPSHDTTVATLHTIGITAASIAGKTHLFIALGREAIKLGMSVAFYSAEELGSLLDRALKEGTIKQKLYQLSKPKLLVLDEFGYTPFSSASAPLLFRLINSRYEQKSILITSNKPVSEWAGVLGDATLTTAMLDRLLHHSEIIVIRGDSYRLLEKRKEGLLTSARAVGTALTD